MMNLEKIKLAVIGLGYVGLPLAVEFGKKLAGDIERRLDALGSDPDVSPYDPSTAHWVKALASG